MPIPGVRCIQAWGKRLLLVVLLAILAACASNPNQSNNLRAACPDPSSSLLWRVAGNNSDVYLFGTLHLGRPYFYPLPPRIERAFRRADFLVFEADPNALQAPQFAADLLLQASLPPGERLQDQLSPATYTHLLATLTAQGLPAQQYLQFRTWYLSLLLANQQMFAYGYEPQYGVETYLHANKSDGTRVLALESVDEQLQSMTALEGEDYLVYTLNSMNEGKSTLDQLSAAWLCADKAVLRQMLVASLDENFVNTQNKTVKNNLLVDRNKQMADTIRTFIESGSGNYFVAIGTAHFLGEDNVLELLNEAGYEVKAITLK